MPKVGVRVEDKHFVIGWSLADEKKVQQYTKRMSELYFYIEAAAAVAGDNYEDPVVVGLQTEYSKLADIMIDLVKRRDNDHHNAKAELGHDWLSVEPINDPMFEPDLVTFQGLNKLLKIYKATTTGVFKWIGRGTAASTLTPYTNTLSSETGTRLDSTTAGFHDIAGASIRLFAAYASSTSTSTIHQIGVFDAVTSGMLFAIHDFGGNSFSHVANAESFSLGMVCDFIPFGDY